MAEDPIRTEDRKFVPSGFFQKYVTVIALLLPVYHIYRYKRCGTTVNRHRFEMGDDR
jgi:hypothetical protein